MSWANSIDLDRTPQHATSDQGLHYLSLIQLYFDTRMNLVKYTVARSYGVPMLRVIRQGIKKRKRTVHVLF